MTLVSKRVANEVELHGGKDPRHRSAINAESFVDRQEWRLHREVHLPIIYKLCSTVPSVL